MEQHHPHAPTSRGGTTDLAHAVQERLGQVARRFIPARRFGWAFLLAWVFCVFYTDAAGVLASATSGASASQTTMPGPASLPALYYAAFPLFCSVATLVAAVLSERGHGSPLSRPNLTLAAPVACAVGTPLLYVSASSPAVTAVTFGAGSVLTGFGSGLLWVMWGEYFATLDRDDVEFLSPASGFFAVALILIVAHIDDWLSVALVTAFPIICGGSLALCARASDAGALGDVAAARRGATMGDFDRRAVHDAHANAAKSPSRALGTMAPAATVILVSCAVVCILGLGAPRAGANVRATTSGASDASLLLSAAVMWLVYVGATGAARHVSATFLVRWMTPLLLFGIGCTVWLPGEVGFETAKAVSIAARFGFCVFTQMYFALIASSGGVTPTQSYGIGWVAVHAGDLVGLVLGVELRALAPAGPLFGPPVAMAMAFVLVVVVLTVIERVDAPLGTGMAPATPGTCSARDDASGTGAGGAFAEGRRTDPRPVEGETGRRAAATGDEASSDGRETRLRELAASGGLTPREVEVLRLLAQGRSVPFIRDELVISKDTASTHVKHIYAKLGVHSRQELLDLFE
ncbi:MAG: helix-turn-helix transcriptional regulator [Coriobacteriales bacterium]